MKNNIYEKKTLERFSIAFTGFETMIYKMSPILSCSRNVSPIKHLNSKEHLTIRHEI